MAYVLRRQGLATWLFRYLIDTGVNKMFSWRCFGINVANGTLDAVTNTPTIRDCTLGQTHDRKLIGNY